MYVYLYNPGGSVSSQTNSMALFPELKTTLSPLILNSHTQKAKCTQISQFFFFFFRIFIANKLFDLWVQQRVLKLPGKQHCNAMHWFDACKTTVSFYIGMDFLFINDPYTTKINQRSLALAILQINKQESGAFQRAETPLLFWLF